MSATRVLKRQHTSLAAIAGLAGIVIICAGIKSAGDFLGLTFLAGLLVIALQPMRRWLVAHGTPRWLATTALVLTIYLILIAMLGALALSIAQLVDVLPKYSDDFNRLWQQALDYAHQHGMATDELKEKATGALSSGAVIDTAKAVVGSISQVLTDVFIVVFLVAFISMDTSDTRSRTSLVARHKPALARAFGAFADRTRTYIIVTTVFGLIVAVLDYGALLALGVPMALTWGIVSFVTNFIPNIGFVVGLVPPALLALVDSGPTTAIWVVVLYFLFNNGIQGTLQPKIVGDSVGLNTTVTFVSLLLWSYVVGPLGAILAVPLTLFFKALLVDSDPDAAWINAYLDVPASTQQESREKLRRLRAPGLEPAGPWPEELVSRDDDRAGAATPQPRQEQEAGAQGSSTAEQQPPAATDEPATEGSR